MAFGNPYGYYQPPAYFGQTGAAPDQLNQYKMPYQQPMMQQPMMQQPQAQAAAGGTLLFVLGEAEAAAYPVTPGATVCMWDKNESTVYIKSVDAAGIPSMRILDYTERAAQPAQKKPDAAKKEYVTVEEFRQLAEKYEQLAGKLESMNAPGGGSHGERAV